jgi:hypothetical protein
MPFQRRDELGSNSGFSPNRDAFNAIQGIHLITISEAFSRALVKKESETLLECSRNFDELSRT